MIALEQVEHAVSLPDFDWATAHLRMAPASRPLTPPNGISPRQAGVLELLFPENGSLHLVLTRRMDTLRGHSGQISFPGGRRDPEDESFTATALRETCEELGVCDPNIRVIGTLSKMYIPNSNFEVYPTVAYLPQRPNFVPNPAEVAEVFTFPLDALLDDQYKALEDREFNGMKIAVPYYAINGHKVWGATAVMLSELEGRLRAVIPVES
jgi:8-oxo-dGTP pyrophosphatase MutT (NUDIX family)